MKRYLGWVIITIAWLIWIFATAGCSDDPREPTMPDAASGLPWCQDIDGCRVWEYDRACGTTRVCFCGEIQCEPPVKMIR